MLQSCGEHHVFFFPFAIRTSYYKNIFNFWAFNLCHFSLSFSSHSNQPTNMLLKKRPSPISFTQLNSIFQQLFQKWTSSKPTQTKQTSQQCLSLNGLTLSFAIMQQPNLNQWVDIFLFLNLIRFTKLPKLYYNSF